jgi:hypothetical protein
MICPGESPLDGYISKLNLTCSRRVVNRLTIEASTFATCIKLRFPDNIAVSRSKLVLPT